MTDYTPAAAWHPDRRPTQVHSVPAYQPADLDGMDEGEHAPDVRMFPQDPAEYLAYPHADTPAVLEHRHAEQWPTLGAAPIGGIILDAGTITPTGASAGSPVYVTVGSKGDAKPWAAGLLISSAVDLSANPVTVVADGNPTGATGLVLPIGLSGAVQLPALWLPVRRATLRFTAAAAVVSYALVGYPLHRGG